MINVCYHSMKPNRGAGYSIRLVLYDFMLSIWSFLYYRWKN